LGCHRRGPQQKCKRIEEVLGATPRYSWFTPRPIIDRSITAGRVGHKIKKAYREDGYKSVTDITSIVKEEIGPENRTPSRSTVYNYLKKQGLKKHKLLKKPLLSARNVERRLAFALAHLEDPDLLNIY
jgi:hypothetical protein